MAQSTPRQAPPSVAALFLAVAFTLGACEPLDATSSAQSGTPTPAALPATCPSPTNDVTLDMELGVPLLYPGTLNVFNVFWGEHWDDDPANFRRDDVNQALRDVVATPYFDRLCQYGVPGFTFEGSSDTDGFIYPCSRSPGAVTSTPSIFGYMSCAEYAPLTGVPVSLGAPNPFCVACSGLPIDCANVVTLPGEPLCLATPNPTGNRVYVVLLPKGTIIDDFGSRSCAPGGYNAYHFQIPSRAVFAPFPPFVVPGTQGRPLNLAVIPTECFTDLASLVTAITHEVVEAATDPLPLAHWIDASSASPGGVFDITQIGSLFKEGEANDICATLGFRQTPFTGATGLSLGVAPYWSNADNSCVSLDSTPPVTTAALVPPPSADGWNPGDVTVTLTAVDPGASPSGVREIVHSATGAQPIASTTVPGASSPVPFTAEGVSLLSFHAVDQAGNVEADRFQTVRIDRTAPVVTWSGNAGSYTVDQPVALTCAASDVPSGVATTTCVDVAGPAWSFGLGSHTVSASATDLAGNSAVGSATFAVEVTTGSLCNLARTFSIEPRVADRLCCLLARVESSRCCRQAEKALEEVRQETCEETGDAFTEEQATVLDTLAAALQPADCRPHHDGDGDDDEDGDDLRVSTGADDGRGGRGHHGDACDDDRRPHGHDLDAPASGRHRGGGHHEDDRCRDRHHRDDLWTEVLGRRRG